MKTERSNNKNNENNSNHCLERRSWLKWQNFPVKSYRITKTTMDSNLNQSSDLEYAALFSRGKFWLPHSPQPLKRILTKDKMGRTYRRSKSDNTSDKKWLGLQIGTLTKNHKNHKIWNTKILQKHKWVWTDSNKKKKNQR